MTVIKTCPRRVAAEEILQQGWVMKESKHMQHWRERFMVLTDTHLLTFCCESKGEFKTRKATEKIRLGFGVQIQSLPISSSQRGAEFAVSFRNEHGEARCIKLLAPSEEARSRWIHEITKAKIPARVRMATAELPIY
uniref:PH domain-containing protein n=1 Tax=Oxyrrhis marina TaxID=2969 RepID=A0A7S4GLL4_OXYMA|mmetsp:Transcript_43978/g.108318  ORF Transcript_43978/g.108318 Transcript_43978/m.108318 type:complete len:137 (+) Transcript_43978:48-458(+)